MNTHDYCPCGYFINLKLGVCTKCWRQMHPRIRVHALISNLTDTVKLLAGALQPDQYDGHRRLVARAQDSIENAKAWNNENVAVSDFKLLFIKELADEAKFGDIGLSDQDSLEVSKLLNQIINIME